MTDCLTGLPELDTQIAAKLDVKSLAAFFRVNRYTASLNTDVLWRTKLKNLLSVNNGRLETKRAAREVYIKLRKLSTPEKRLKWALREDEIDLARLLLENSDIDIHYSEELFLEIAITSKNITLIKLLLSRGADPLGVATLLDHMIETDDQEIVITILNVLPVDDLSSYYINGGVIQIAGLSAAFKSLNMVRFSIKRGLRLWELVDNSRLILTNPWLTYAVFDKECNAPESIQSECLSSILSEDMLDTIALKTADLQIKQQDNQSGKTNLIQRISALFGQKDPLQVINRLLAQPGTVLRPIDCLYSAVLADNQKVVFSLLNDKNYIYSSTQLETLRGYAFNLGHKEILRLIEQRISGLIVTTERTMREKIIETKQQLSNYLAQYSAFIGIFWTILLIWLLGKV